MVLSSLVLCICMLICSQVLLNNISFLHPALTSCRGKLHQYICILPCTRKHTMKKIPHIIYINYVCASKLYFWGILSLNAFSKTHGLIGFKKSSPIAHTKTLSVVLKHSDKMTFDLLISTESYFPTDRFTKSLARSSLKLRNSVVIESGIY